MDSNILITALVGALTSIVSGWVSWFFTRKKYNSEVDSTIIENMEESLKFYEKLSQDNRDRLEEILRRNTELEQEVNRMKRQLSTLVFLTCKDMTCQLRQMKSLEEM